MQAQYKRMLQDFFQLNEIRGKYISNNWRYLIYWELLYGYVLYKDNKDFMLEINEWLLRFLKLGGPLSEDEYLEMIFQEALGFMQSEWHIPSEWKNPHDWCKTGKWMEGKSGTGKNTFVEIQRLDPQSGEFRNRKKRTRRMKALDGVFFSNDIIEQELKTPTYEDMHIIQKVKVGKYVL